MKEGHKKPRPLGRGAVTDEDAKTSKDVYNLCDRIISIAEANAETPEREISVKMTVMEAFMIIAAFDMAVGRLQNA